MRWVRKLSQASTVNLYFLIDPVGMCQDSTRGNTPTGRFLGVPFVTHSRDLEDSFLKWLYYWEAWNLAGKFSIKSLQHWVIILSVEARAMYKIRQGYLKSRLGLTTGNSSNIPVDSPGLGRSRGKEVGGQAQWACFFTWDRNRSEGQRVTWVTSGGIRGTIGLRVWTEYVQMGHWVRVLDGDGVV